MPAPVFIGDEVTATGFRLAGADVRMPAPAAETAVLREALRGHDLVLITAEVAGRVDPRLLKALLASAHPVVMLVPDARGAVPLPDLAAQVRSQLGMGE
jgi:vacuolar-type H+-ATPase subunit F/Vma7